MTAVTGPDGSTVVIIRTTLRAWRWANANASDNRRCGYANKVILDFSRRGKPTDNATIECFNGRFRSKCLNVHWFLSLEDAEAKIEATRLQCESSSPSSQGSQPQ